MKKTCWLVLPLLCLVVCPGCPLFSPPMPRDGAVDSDLAVMHAKIFTSNAGRPWAQAVAVKDKRIVYVGDNRGLRDFVGPNTRIVNARGKMLTPGFIDSHSHIVWLGILNAVMTSLYPATSVDGVTQIIQDFANSHPELPFVMGIGWKYDYIPGGIPTLAMADAILADRPLILWSHDGHTGWVNSPALALMQEANPDAFRRLTPEFDGTGQPNGIFLHFYAINPFDFFPIDGLGPEILSAMAGTLKDLLDEALSVGVTMHHDVMIHRAVFDLLLEMLDRGAFERARARCAYFMDHHVLEDEDRLMADLAVWKGHEADSTEHLILGQSIKLGIDGVAGNHTSFMSEEYSDAPGNFGIASWSQEDFDRITAILDAQRFQICTHATGDAGITRVINSYAALPHDWDARHVIEHCSRPQAADIQRMADLGIHASMQPAHLFSDETIERALGPERVQLQHPCGSLQRAGVNVAFGTDYSIVPLNPLYGLLVASTRLNYHLGTWGPEEAISIEDGIRHYTIDSARTQKVDDVLGSIEVGKFADFVLFDMDLRVVDNPLFLLLNGVEIGSLDTHVLMTVVDGRIVYYRGGETLK